MCEPSNERNVTARQLSRNAATILDEVEFDGRSMLVIRHRRVVARITPVHGAPLRRRIRDTEASADRSPASGTAEDVELDADEREILLTAQRARGFWRPEMMRDRHTEYWRAARRLEDRELLFHGWMGHQLTRRGRSALQGISVSGVPLA